MMVPHSPRCRPRAANRSSPFLAWGGFCPPSAYRHRTFASIARRAQVRWAREKLESRRQDVVNRSVRFGAVRACTDLGCISPAADACIPTFGKPACRAETPCDSKATLTFDTFASSSRDQGAPHPLLASFLSLSAARRLPRIQNWCRPSGPLVLRKHLWGLQRRSCVREGNGNPRPSARLDYSEHKSSHWGQHETD